MTEDEMVVWHHQLNGHGFGWTPGVGDGPTIRGPKEAEHTEGGTASPQ